MFLVPVALAAIVWLWIAWCRFPASPWNDLRLTAAFMAAKGEPVYTLPGQGVLTTWMYGPVPLWLWSSASFARDASTALLGAGAINIVFTLAAVAATCIWWPANATSLHRWLAMSAAVLLWPEHSWRFLEADNVSIALGLAANLLLMSGSRSPTKTWLAALATAAALGCKQTTLGLPLAQLLWLWHSEGRNAAGHQLVRIILAGLALAGLAIAQFGFHELWFGVVTAPRALPLTDDIGARLLAAAPRLVLEAGLPLALLAWRGRRLLDRAESLSLPLLTCVCSLPLGIAGLLSTGGTVNSLQGFHFLLPAALLSVLAASSAFAPRLLRLAPVAAIGLVLARITLTEDAPVLPALDDVRIANEIARSHPGSVWLPWNPLITYFADGRFYHAEDGIYVRFITGHPVTVSQALAGVPEDFRALAIPGPRMQWGVALKLAPEIGRTESRAGAWVIWEWPQAPKVPEKQPAAPASVRRPS